MFLASPEDNGIVLEKEISKEEVIGIIELYKRTSAATETAQLQKIVLQMDKYGVRGNSVSSHLQGEREVCQGHLVCLEREDPPASVLLRAELLGGLCSSTKFCCSRKAAAAPCTASTKGSSLLPANFPWSCPGPLLTGKKVYLFFL